MKTFGNIIWHFPFFGFLDAIVTYLLGVLLTATVVAAPIGLGLMELGKLLFAPFGKAMISVDELELPQNQAWKAYSTVIMILYLPFGLVLAFLTVIQMGLLFISIIGIPVGMVLAKSLGTYFNPVGKKCVSSEVAAEIEKRKAEHYLSSNNMDKVAPLAEKLSQLARQEIFCPECGKQNQLLAKFCGGCGKQLPMKQLDATEPISASKPHTISTAVNLLWAFLAIGLISALLNSSSLMNAIKPPITQSGFLFFLCCWALIYGDLIRRTSKGSNRARIWLTILFALDLLGLVMEIHLGRIHRNVTVSLLGIGLQGYALFLLYSKHGSTWFSKAPSAEPAKQPTGQMESRKLIWVIAGVFAVSLAVVATLKFNPELSTKIRSLMSFEKLPSDLEKLPVLAPPTNKAPEGQPLVSKHNEAEPVITHQEVATPVVAPQKPDTVKQPSQKADQTRLKRVQKSKPEHQQEARPIKPQPSPNQEIQSISIHEQPEENVQPADSPTEQKKRHRGLRGLIEQTTGTDPGEVKGTTVHECTDGEKAMHVNGC